MWLLKLVDPLNSESFIAQTGVGCYTFHLTCARGLYCFTAQMCRVIFIKYRDQCHNFLYLLCIDQKFKGKKHSVSECVLMGKWPSFFEMSHFRPL